MVGGCEGCSPGPSGNTNGPRSNCPLGPIGNIGGGPPLWNTAKSLWWSKRGPPECLPTMKPVPKTTATMNTTPATIPTHAATWFSRLGR